MLVTPLVDQLTAVPRLQGRTALPILVQKTIFFLYFLFNLVFLSHTIILCFFLIIFMVGSTFLNYKYFLYEISK